MKIIETIVHAINFDGGYVIVEIGTEKMLAEDRIAEVNKKFYWEWNEDETKRVVTEIEPAYADDVVFNEEQGNRALAAIYANKLITKEFIKKLIQ